MAKGFSARGGLWAGGGRAFEPLEPRALLTTILVDNDGDTDDGDYSAGQVTLREAVALSNLLGDEDVIVFAEGIERIQLLSDLVVTGPVRISGTEGATGRDHVELTGRLDTTREIVFDDGDDATALDITVEGVFTRDDGVHYYENGGGGVALHSAESLTVVDCVISDALVVSGGVVTVEGGASAPSLTVLRTAFQNSYGNAGVIAASGVSSVTIDSIEIAENRTGHGRGAVDIVGADSVEIVNSTIAWNNEHSTSGVALDIGSGTATIGACSIDWNGDAGVRLVSGSLTLVSTIVSRNGDDGDRDIVIEGGTLDLEASTNNLVSNADAAGGLEDRVRGNLVGRFPSFGDLGDHGGPTRTLPLLDGSPARDAGTNALGLDTDQRGGIHVRESGAPDIGALEAQSFTFIVDSAASGDDGDLSAGETTFHEAIAQANRNPDPDTIEFDASLSGATIALDSRLSVLNDITIDGLGSHQLTLEGAGGLVVASGVTAVIQELTITGATRSAIENNGSMNVLNVRFIGNSTGGDGGAIRSMGTAHVVGCTFIGNTAAGEGGAIWSRGYLTVALSTLSDNSAGSTGGAIMIRRWAGRPDDLDHLVSLSTLTGNSSGLDGGAVHAADPVLISGSTFEGNSADGHGGAVFASREESVITDSDFTGNAAAHDGGAVATAGAIEESTFSSNTAGRNGGAVFGWSVDSCVFDSNHAAEAGGAIFGHSGLIIMSSELQNNSADIGGGAATNGGMIVEGSELTNNRADRDGGAAWSGYEVTLRDVEARQNEAGRHGGAAYGLETVTVFSSRISSNAAGAQGGGVATSGNAPIRATSMAGNSAGTHGGAVSARRAVIETSSLADNTAGSNGGAVWTSHSLRMTDSTVVRSFALSGGALFGRLSMRIEGSTLEDNTALADGGAIALISGEGMLTGSVLRGSSAMRGGGVFAVGSFEVGGSELAEHESGGAGSGIWVEGALSLWSSTIAENAAVGDGGGVWVRGDLDMLNSTISANTSNGSGAGLRLVEGDASVRYSTVASNRANEDGQGFGLGGIGVGGDGAASLLLTATIVAHNVTAGSTLSEIAAFVFGAVDPDSTFNLVFDAGTSGGIEDGAVGNIVGVDPGLGALISNGGHTRTHAVFPGSPAVDASGVRPPPGTDQRGEARPHGEAPDIGAFEWQPVSGFSLGAHDGAVIGPETGGAGFTRLVVWNLEDSQIVFRQRASGDWEATRPLDSLEAPSITGNALIWTDPDDGDVRVGGASAEGFVVYLELGGGEWGYRNLSDELGVGDDTPVASFTWFESVRGLVVVIGVSAGGELVAFRQEIGDDGARAWTFENISEQLDAQGMTTPELGVLTSYVTPWDAWNVAGIDGDGQVQAVWVHPRTFSMWRVDNLSAITGAPPLQGQLAVTQTHWQSIIIAGTDASGSLIATWWVPRFGADWVTSDLTDLAGGPALVPGNLTGWVSEWNALNFVGVDEQGSVVAYWWTPNRDMWAASVLSGSVSRPTGALTSHSSPTGEMSILGRKDDGDVMRLWWSPREQGAWRLENLTDLAERV